MPADLHRGAGRHVDSAAPAVEASVHFAGRPSLASAAPLEQPPPRPRIRKEEEAEPSSRSGSVIALIVGIAGGVFLLTSVAVGGIWWLAHSANDDKGPSTQVAAVKEVSSSTGSRKETKPEDSGAGTRSRAEPAPRKRTEQPDEASAPESDEPAAPRSPRGQLSARALKDLKGATVFIKVEAGKDLSCSGSGFLVKVEGDTGYVITNHHVVNPEAELLKPVRSRSGVTTVRTVKVRARNAAVTAVFHSGAKGEQPVPADVIATDESRDLAVLRVTGLGDWPRPITLDQKAALVETMPVYILGFPFGEQLSFKHGNPAITINKGSVSSLRENDYGQMKAVQIDGAINPGNSGGPVVDEDGRLVGISVATIRGSGIGLAIAPDELKRLFEGRVSVVDFAERKFADDTGADYQVTMQFIDPENQIKSASLLYVVESTPHKPLNRNSNGIVDALPGADRLDLQFEGKKASGLLELTFNGAGKRFLNYQAIYVNGSGKEVRTQVFSKARVRGQQPNPRPANP